LSWELRAAISLARLLRNQRRLDEACRTLQPVYDRFVEGFDSTDLKTAKALLDSLQ
jgi:predicted ATPase